MYIIQNFWIRNVQIILMENRWIERQRIEMEQLDPESDEAVAARLKLLREVLGYVSGASFAAFLGISPQRWNNFEVAKPLSKDVALKLVRTVPGISLDWLYRGRAEALSFEMARKLGALSPPAARKVRKAR
jgi:hypothetical protein